MKNQKSSAGGILFRAIGFLVAGVMISMVFLGTLDTNSWFTAKMTANMEVTAASTEDILEYFYIVEDKPGQGNRNSTAIKLKKAEGAECSPTIYFEVTGDAADYIPHINPVKLKGYQEYSRSIDVAIDSAQYQRLKSLQNNSRIEGKVRVKYLNDFIDEELKISFRVKYLTDKYEEKIRRNFSSENEMANYIADMASLTAWSEPIVESNFLIASPPSTIKSFGIQSDSPNESGKQTYKEELASVPIKKLELTEHQSKIISIIAPTLQKYLDNLYNVVVNLVERINEKIRVIVGLERQVEVLEEEAEELNEKLDEAKVEISELENENEELKEENGELRKENKKLLQETEELNKEIDRLSSALRSQQNSKNQEINSLLREIESLREALASERNANTQQPGGPGGSPGGNSPSIPKDPNNGTDNEGAVDPGEDKTPEDKDGEEENMEVPKDSDDEAGNDDDTGNDGEAGNDDEAGNDYEADMDSESG
ncbi:MAG: hypothetical protein JJT76_10365 [Clostridiaceae bacterium]|nr:hypothetical protein [Clostridiaceae bacterium]